MWHGDGAGKVSYSSRHLHGLREKKLWLSGRKGMQALRNAKVDPQVKSVLQCWENSICILLAGT